MGSRLRVLPVVADGYGGGTITEAATGPMAYCRENDDIHAALHLLGEARVRRLPVVNANDELVGMIGINDLILAARPMNGRKPELDDEEVIETMRRICAHASRQVMAVAVAMTA